MLLTERQLRKVIQESILAHSREQDIAILESKAKRSKMLVETHRGTGFITFGSLLERADRGLISGEQLCDILEEDFERINHQLLQEGVFDLIQGAYEKAKDGVIKIKDTISDKVAKAIETVNDKYIEWTTKIWMVCQKGKEYALKAIALIGKGFDVIAKFKKKHPILYRIICIILAMIVIAIIMIVFSAKAKAGTPPEGVQLDQNTTDQVYGCMKKAYQHAAPGGKGYQYDNSHIAIRDAAIHFKKAASGGQTFDPSTMGNHANTCMANIKKLQQFSEIGDGASQAAKTASKTLEGYVKLAEKVNKYIDQSGTSASDIYNIDPGAAAKSVSW